MFFRPITEEEEENNFLSDYERKLSRLKCYDKANNGVEEVNV